MKKIIIDFIPHRQQRYDTVGDYFEQDGSTRFRISRFDDPRHSWLVLIHEMVEYFLVVKANISIDEIDHFDMTFTGDSEPGDSLSAPYFLQHQAASMVERICAILLGVDWKEYDRAVEQLSTAPQPASLSL